MQIEKLLEEVNVEFQKVNKKFMSDIENGREDGLYVLDTKLFLNWHKQSLKQFIDGLVVELEEKRKSYCRCMCENTIKATSFNDGLETAISHLKEIRKQLE